MGRTMALWYSVSDRDVTKKNLTWWFMDTESGLYTGLGQIRVTGVGTILTRRVVDLRRGFGKNIVVRWQGGFGLFVWFIGFDDICLLHTSCNKYSIQHSRGTEQELSGENGTLCFSTRATCGIRVSWLDYTQELLGRGCRDWTTEVLRLYLLDQINIHPLP